MDEYELTPDQLRALMEAGWPAVINPGPRPQLAEVDWEAEAAVWGDDTRKWAEEAEGEDPDSDA